MADEKPGKVLRVSPTVQEFLKARKGPKETFDALIRRLIGLPRKREKTDFVPFVDKVEELLGEIQDLREEVTAVRSAPSLFVLPSDISESAAEARGRAVIEAVRAKKKPERPIEVKKID